MAGLVDNPINPFTNKPVNSDAKSEPQYITASQNFSVDKKEYSFGNTQWFTVQDNIYDMSNWQFISESTPLPNKQ